MPNGHPAISRAEALRLLSLAADLGVGLPAGHGLGASYIALRLGQELGASAADQSEIAEVALLKDAGCTSWTTQIAAMIRGDEIAARRDVLFFREFGSKREVMGWAARYVGAGSPLPARITRLGDFLVSGRDFMREGFQSGAEVACRIAGRLGGSQAVNLALACLFEQWNGKGMPRGLRGDAIPLPSRIVFAASYFEASRGEHGRDAALNVAHERSGTAFDPAVVAAFERLAVTDGFWEPLEAPGVLPAFVDEHLATSIDADLDDLASCCADFVDMKAYWLAGHSRRVAELAARAARRLSFPEGRVREVRRAGLIHDLGLVSIPSFVLNKPPDERDPEERDMVASHGEVLRGLLEPFEALRSIGEIAAMAAGRDASVGPADDAMVLAAGAIAAAHAFDQFLHDAPGEAAMQPEQAAGALQRKFAAGPFEAAAQALAAEVEAAAVSRNPQWPGGLTGREVEVLRLLASGRSRKQIAHDLVVSESTVRSHMEHIYSKLGVSTRVGAVLFAIENDLMP